MIKRIAQTAGFSGLLAALLLTLLQSFWVAPLILQAETYEKAPASEAHEHTGAAMAGHSHESHAEEAWEPEDGWQRVLSTTGGNLVVAVGFPVTRRSAWHRPWACHRNCPAPLRRTCCNGRSGGPALRRPPPWPLPCSSSVGTGR